MTRKVHVLLPDAVVCRAVVDSAREAGIPDRHIHVIGSHYTPLEGLPEAGLADRSEFTRGLELGLGVGGVAGLLGGLLAVTFPPAGLVLGGGAVLASTLVGALVDGDGNPLTTVTIAGLDNDAQFSHPAVIFDGANYLVVFQTLGEIHGRFIQPAGTPNGDAFILSTGSSNWQPVLAFDGARALVAWAKHNGTDYDIYGAFVDNIGPDTSEFPLVNDSSGQDEPAIAFDGVNYLVLYRNYTTLPESEYGDIYGRRFNINGVGLAPSPMPVCTAAHGQGAPQLAFDGVNFFAVWVDLRNSQYDIYGSGIDTAGTILDGPTNTGGIAINTRAGILRAYPAVCFDGTNYLVTWSAGDPGGTPASLLNSGIFANRVSPTGTLVDATATDLGIPISEPPLAANQYIYPVVYSGATHSLLTWVDNTEVMGTTKNLRSAMIWPF